MTARQPIRVCIDARISGFDGRSGGTQHVLLALARAFSALEPDGEEYIFLTYDEHDGWLRPSLGRPCTPLAVKRPPPTPPAPRKPLPMAMRLRQAWWNLNHRLGNPHTVHVERSDGTIERAGIDVMHFTLPPAFLTGVPNIYLPHDLQHRHFPEYFSRAERAFRDVAYTAFARQARLVMALTPWGREDLVNELDLAPEAVAVVPWAPVTGPRPTAAEMSAARAKFSLPERFLLFPALTWPNKNHARLIAALARLRNDEGLSVNVVCSGHRLEPHYTKLERLLARRGMSELVRFTGFVTETELASFYALSAGLVFPSTFEGWGLPVTEAFVAGKPVACSRIPVLEQIAGPAARYFDPFDERSIGEAVKNLWTNPHLSDDLVRRGKERVGLFTWERTARLLRANYRRVAGRTPDEEDAALLAQPFPEAA